MTSDAPWWQEDLERLRREQNPGKHDPQQPALRLPTPNHSPWGEHSRPLDDDASDRGVHVIDM